MPGGYWPKPITNCTKRATGCKPRTKRLLLTEEEAAALPLIDYPPPLPPFLPPEEEDTEDGPEGA